MRTEHLKPGASFAWIDPDTYASLPHAKKIRVRFHVVESVTTCNTDKSNVHIHMTDRTRACAPREREIVV